MLHKFHVEYMSRTVIKMKHNIEHFNTVPGKVLLLKIHMQKEYT